MHGNSLLVFWQIFCFIWKQWRLQEKLSGTGTNVTVGQMFGLLQGCHFPSEDPATENKTETPKTLFCLLFERYSQRKSILMEVVNKSLCPEPCFMLYHTASTYSRK